MRAHGYEPIVRPADVDETLPDNIGMEEAVEYLSEIKAISCYKDLLDDELDNLSHSANKFNNIDSEILRANIEDEPHENLLEDALVIAADTVVYTDELGIMGKPADYDEAFKMLATIRGTAHYVATGVTLIDTDTKEQKTFVEVTTVHCKDYSDEDIAKYIEEDQPYDKAGSYAIQSTFGEHIAFIEGDYENVVGLPFNRIVEECK